MTVHANDVVIAIRETLRDNTMAEQQTIPRYRPNHDGRAFPNRDGHFQFDAVGRDWIRAFRITVEAIDIDDVDADELATPSEDEEWIEQPPT